MRSRRTPCLSTLTIVLAILGAPWYASAGQLPLDPPIGPHSHTTTPYIHDVYGYVTVNGSDVAEGDEVAAFDPDGVCCGVWKVDPGKEPQYGFMAVYGDDPDTPGDEGANAGDQITFRIWDKSEDFVYTTAEVLSSWENGGGPDRLDLTADTPLPVMLSTFVALGGEAESTLRWVTEITLRWVTESEIDNLGFHVYRAPSEEGEYQRLTAEVIRGAGTTAERHEYTFTDVRLTPGVTYWYKIEDVAFDGTRTMHGPIAVTPRVREQGLTPGVAFSSFTAEAGDGEVALHWVTEREVENLGFIVYRALAEDGVYERLTGELIAGAGTSTGKQAYAFTDREVCQSDMWYMLESVSSDGTSTKHGPVVTKSVEAVMPSTWGTIKRQMAR